MSGTEDTIGSSCNFAPARVHMAQWEFEKDQAESTWAFMGLMVRDEVGPD